MELSGTCTCLVVKFNIFVLVSFAWFCRVIVSRSTLWSVLVKECFSHCYHQKFPETVSLSVQFQLCVTKIFYQIGDFHFLAIWLLFPSVMSILYGGPLKKVFKMFLASSLDVTTGETTFTSCWSVCTDSTSFKPGDIAYCIEYIFLDNISCSLPIVRTRPFQFANKVQRWWRIGLHTG